MFCFVEISKIKFESTLESKFECVKFNFLMFEIISLITFEIQNCNFNKIKIHTKIFQDLRIPPIKPLKHNFAYFPLEVHSKSSQKEDKFIPERTFHLTDGRK